MDKNESRKDTVLLFPTVSLTDANLLAPLGESLLPEDWHKSWTNCSVMMNMLFVLLWQSLSHT